MLLEGLGERMIPHIVSARGSRTMGESGYFRGTNGVA